jgi:hypothetical protein
VRKIPISNQEPINTAVQQHTIQKFSNFQHTHRRSHNAYHRKSHKLKSPQQQIAPTIPDKKETEKSIKINGVKDFNEEQE